MAASHPHLDSLAISIGRCVFLGDDAVDARRGHHLVADFGGGHQCLLVLHPLLLRAKEEEVHQPDDREREQESHGEIQGFSAMERWRG
jgi:hypothetical protein